MNRAHPSLRASSPSSAVFGAPNAPEIPQDKSALIHLYRQMQLLRKFERAAQVACRSGETPGFLHLYIGEEAVATGVCAHLRTSDWITSTHRGHGHALAKGMSAKTLMAELYGRSDGCCGGRGGTMHLYDASCGLFGTNGLVGGGIPAAVGAAISAKQRGTDDVAVAFFGDGAVNHGAFHESLNFAGVMRAPVVFVCENNLYATATALSNVTLNAEIWTRAAAYGIPGEAVDGNDVLAVWAAAARAIDRARSGSGPTLIEAKTYRTVGHHEGDPVTGVYRTQAEVDAWAERCPVATFRERIVSQLGVASTAELDVIDQEIDHEVADSIDFARRSPEPTSSSFLRHVYGDPINPPEANEVRISTQTTETGWLDAVRDGIAEEMRRNHSIIYFGEGTGERGGTFAHTKYLWQEFGGDRMVDTPISELGFTGAALGASATGVRCIADLMFADFLFEAAGQIALQAAKLRYMSNGKMSAPMVIRAGAGAVRSAGPHHSGTYHSVWAHIPGLIVCMPATPADAKGLMKTALRAHDPVIMLEPKALFSSKGPVPQGEYFVPFGVARVAREGRHLTMAAAGQMVQRCLEAADHLASFGVEAEIIDMRTIQPLDVESVAASVRKTNHLLVVDEGWAMFGLGAELGQSINELCFDYLDGPVARLHSEPVTHPFAPALEHAMVVTVERIVAAAREALAGVVKPIRRVIANGSPATFSPVSSVANSVPETAPSSPNVELAAGAPIKMPFGDLTVSEGKFVRWLKAIDQSVVANETIAEIETDKALVEIEAPTGGRLVQRLCDSGDVVKMGQTIGVIR